METNISAHTLFHFTYNKNSLLSILKNGLYVRYSLENFESLINDKAEIVFPMTCFCDIPLSHVRRHTNTYGKYAIGLSKSWGMKNQINPIIYTYPNSATTTILNEIFENIENFFDINEIELEKIKINKSLETLYWKFNDRENEFSKRVESLNSKLSHFIRYIKPYEGKFYRNGDYLENPIRFYDEREWRFTPSREFLFSKEMKDSYKSEYFIDPKKRRALNIKLAKHIKLEFEPNDVKFIIVERDNEIPDMIKKLDDIFGKTASSNDLKLLGTRLISLEQILENL
ncbi:abortive infection system antitoxin AbiGi family protein [Flavobacterium sp.]|uniref:abortive infection system antitoxin AbiGi family protein n=1 Tax=Flavobacterium sp. TaxID=239 RepID=UPI002625A280|nr:abortive infection system antitoxin AbiGi family protein [Flavobacterium sp.]